MKLKNLSNALGVELVDFDLGHSCDEEIRQQLRNLFLQHHLILVHCGSDEEHNRFVEYFGPLSLMGDGEPAGYVTNRGERTFGPGTRRLLWHADGTYGEQPGIGTSLWAKEVEPHAASTAFLDAGLALETLPAALRARIADLSALHLRDLKTENTENRMRMKNMQPDPDPDRYRTFVHPIVYTPPHAERPVLFVNELATSHIIGLSEEESEELLLQLFDHLIRPEHIYTHIWRNGDLVFWDNIALQHCRPREVGSPVRHLRRLTLDGWNTNSGVLDWVGTGGLRDPISASYYGRVKQM